MNSRATISGFTPAARAGAVRPYAPPGAASDLVDLKLDANEGPAPSASVLEWLAERGPELVNRYPSMGGLEALVASRFGVDRERVLVTAGVDDALARMVQATIEPGREAVLSRPTFEMIPRYVALAGGSSVEIPWWAGDYPVEAVVSSIGPTTGCVFVVSPNNPTGLAAGADDLRRVSVSAMDAGGVPVVLDLAYAEYASEDLTASALDLPNCVAMRTFSKAWGMAGLRVGFAIGPPEMIGWMRTVGPVYQTSGPSVAIASDWFEAGESRVMQGVSRVRAERVGLETRLAELGACPVGSEANFVLAWFGERGTETGAERAWAVADGLRARGIGVRRFERGSELGAALRITCPGEVGLYERLSAALGEVLPAASVAATEVCDG